MLFSLNIENNENKIINKEIAENSRIQENEIVFGLNQYQDKELIGSVFPLNNSNNYTHCMNYFIWSDPEKPNVMYAFIDIMSGLSSRPSMTFGGIANDNGTLTVDAWSTYVEA